MTEAELMALPRDGYKRELVDGKIVVSPAGVPHGRVIMKLAHRLEGWIEANDLGYLFDSSTGCWMPSGNLRVPDLTFVSHERMPGGVREGFLEVVPDLVVEVLSPSDSPRVILDKVGEYLSAGVRLVWVIDPPARAAASYRSLTAVRTIDEQGDLDGAEVVPGFRRRLGEILG